MTQTKNQPAPVDDLPIWYGQLDLPATRQRLKDYCKAYEAKVDHYNALLEALRDAETDHERAREEQQILKLYNHFLCKSERELLSKMVRQPKSQKRYWLYGQLKRQPVAQGPFHTMINLVHLYSQNCARIRKNRLDPRIPFTATNGALVDQRHVKCADTVINHRKRLIEAGLISYRFRGTKAPGEYRINTAVLVPKTTSEETMRHLSEAARQHPEQPRFLPGMTAIHRLVPPGLSEKFQHNEEGHHDGDLKKKNESGRTPAASTQFSRDTVNFLEAHWNELDKQQARNQKDGDHDGDRDGNNGHRDDGNKGASSGSAGKKMDTAGAVRDFSSEPKASELITALGRASSKAEKEAIELEHQQRLALHVMLRNLYPGKEFAPSVLEVAFSNIRHFFERYTRALTPEGKLKEFEAVVLYRRYYLDLNRHRGYFQVRPDVWTNFRHKNHIVSAIEYYHKIRKRQKSDPRYYVHGRKIPELLSRYFAQTDPMARAEVVRQAENQLGAHREGNQQALQYFYDTISRGKEKRKHLPARKRHTGA